MFAAESFGRAAEVMAAFAAPLDLPELVLGGGLGVAYVEGEAAPTITEWANVVLDACRAARRAVAVSVEPGRAIVAAAAVTVYTVGTIKRIPGVRTYVAVDGGMSDNPRPVLYGSGYEAFLPRAVDADRSRARRGSSASTASRATCCCSTPTCRPTSPSATSWPCPVTGAYGHSMGSNYNKVPRPPVVFVATARPGSSCAARPTTTCWPPTSGDAVVSSALP